MTHICSDHSAFPSEINPSMVERGAGESPNADRVGVQECKLPHGSLVLWISLYTPWPRLHISSLSVPCRIFGQVRSKGLGGGI